ncbi:lipopolysaccharide kinase InaA family protein [Candidatus Uabimicrobium sp. HlEnr_7]|uniref:lipopolysaccharide kinase InaA family protein n=1 Tax=Candidatus Uabimicrobium helgolandensis TaxID=3095367 RepID=UPI0035578C43
MSKFYINKSYIKSENILSIEDIDALLQEGQFIVKGGNVEVRRLQIGTIMCFIKKYFYKPSYRYLGRCSSAFGEKKSYDCFSKLEIPHPQVILCAEKRVIGKLHWSILATQEIPEATDLVSFLMSNNDHTLRKYIIDKIACMTGHIHNNGFFHGSLRLRNILLTQNTNPFFIDCPKGKYKKTPIGRGFIYDLLSIYKDITRVCTQEESKFFIAKYCAKTGKNIQQWQQKLPQMCYKKFGKMKPLRPLPTTLNTTNK